MSSSDYYTFQPDDDKLEAALQAHLDNYDNNARGIRDALRNGLGLEKPNENDKRMCGSYVETTQLSSFEANLVGNIIWEHSEEKADGEVQNSMQMLARKFHALAKTRDN